MWIVWSMIGVGCAALSLIVWTACVVSSLECSDELSEAGYSDWPLHPSEVGELRDVVEGNHA